MLRWIRSALEGRQEKLDIHNTKSTDNMDKLRELTKSFDRHTEIITSVYRAALSSNDPCYIADMDTYELLWVNNAVTKLYGPNLVGKKCYKAFNNTDFPCSFCTNKMLERRNTYTWVFFNSKIQRRFLIRDRAIKWDGRTVRLEIAIDITELDFNDGRIS